MSALEIEKILHETMGLNTASIGSTAVLSAVQQRMKICQFINVSEYTKKIVSDKNELQELVEEVVVAETWFFRDTQPFKMLTRFITSEWLPSQPNKPIRILSLPCATGEEPYSIAISLIEAGLMPSQLKIDAFDISERNIERCRSAHYSENSFRGVSPYIRDRFFNKVDDSYYPDILIKAMVNFEIASLLDPVFINTQIPYDIVFCRNLLIYFDRETQARASTMLDKLLNPNGMLFIGHAESRIFSEHWFVSQRYPKSFIVRKFNDSSVIKRKNKDTISNSGQTDKLKNNLTTRTHNSKKTRVIGNDKLKPREKKYVTSNNSSLPTATVKSKTPGNGISIARKLADSGKLIEAETVCLECLEDNKKDTEIYYLLAIIQLALGDEQKSVQYLKNVIYLDPDHFDALMYLSTLLGGQGDELGSTRFRERANRIKSRINTKLNSKLDSHHTLNRDKA